MKAKKSLGQNFLHEKNVIQNLVKGVQTEELTSWMEIGCGTGNLTRELLPVSERFAGVELDSDLYAELDEILSVHSEAALVKESILNVEESEIVEHLGEGYGIVGNLPYYITSPILEQVLSKYEHWRVAYFMMQKEVGERILASPGNRVIGRISMFCSYYSNVKRFMTVKRGCFTPPPKVDSVILRFEKKQNLPGKKIRDTFFMLVKAGYSKRRKKLLGLLKSVADSDKIISAYGDLNISEDCRAEELSFEQWMALTERVACD
jgi:16S rRNA (adenine1518-N6/adenine1519-N6)-dimethyltransferase